MLKEHQITEHGRKKENVTGPIDKFMGSNNFTTKRSEFNPEMFKQILLIWMVKHNISFTEVENDVRNQNADQRNSHSGRFDMTSVRDYSDPRTSTPET